MNQDQYNWPEMNLTPIGVVKSPLKTPNLTPTKDNLKLRPSMAALKKQHKQIANTQSEIQVFEPWHPLLKGVEGFSHILVLFWPHLIASEKRKLEQVHPMGREEFPLQGIFATCSPARPNPVLVSAVELVRREENKLIVKGFEAVDQTPVIDIKPYNISYMKKKDIRSPEWMNEINKFFAD